MCLICKSLSFGEKVFFLSHHGTTVINLRLSRHLILLKRLEILSYSQKLWLPSLNALRAFEAVARHGSFRKAADELSVTPAAVQQLVRGLETVLDKRLVERDGRAVRLTETAAEGLSDLREAFELLSRSVGKMRARETRQRLTVSVEPSFASAWLVGRLQRFQDAYPEIEVLIDASFRVADLDRSEADIAIRYCSSVSEQYISKRLYSDETVAVCSPALLAGASPNLRLADIANYTLIHFEWPHQPRLQPDWHTWLKSLGGNGIVAGGNLRFTDYTLALQSAIAGQGVALASRPLVQEALDAKLLMMPLTESVKNGCGYYIVATRWSIEKTGLKAFIDWAESEAQGIMLSK